MFNKYAHINNLALLRKPRKKIIPQGPDLSNFITGNADLRKLANFGLEMMKFLPKFEQLIYAGKMFPERGSDDSNFVTFTHGGVETKVSREWWEAFNEFELYDKDGDGNITGKEWELVFEKKNSDGKVVSVELTDRNGDGRLTNADTIICYEEVNGGDGFTQWRRTWVSGQHHRVGDFGPWGGGGGAGVAGAGFGARFRNIDFVAEANEWNHIGKRNNPDDKNPLYAPEDRAYFVGEILSKVGKKWDDVKNLLDTKFSGKSFYQIVMTRSYESLTPEEAFLLIAAMYESRERAWDAMTQAFGPVTDTRDDQAMISHIDSFLASINAYSNSHALALFPFFLYIQHSFQNRVTMFYYDRSKGDAYNLSKLDDEVFKNFTDWARQKIMDYKDSIDSLSISNDEKTRRKNAIQNLYDEWFGATDPKKGKPLWEGYHDLNSSGDIIFWGLNKETGEGSWVGVNIVKPVWVYAGSWYYASPTQAFKLQSTTGSYGWDRKWNDFDIKVKTSDGKEGWVMRGKGSEGWVLLHNALYGNESYINPRPASDVHPNYGPSQLNGLSFNQIVSGYEFSHNWVVHAVGMYFKKGEGLDTVKVMERCAKRRVAQAEFKKDMKDYLERKEELEIEKAEEEKIAAKAEKKAQAERKKAEQKQEAERKNRSKLSMAEGGPARTEQEKREFQKALQRYSQRILRASAKHKAWLKKIREGN